MKKIIWFGKTHKIIKEYPNIVKREIGYNFDKIQKRLEPVDWKPMSIVGFGVKEIYIAKKRYIEILNMRKLQS